MGAKGKVKLFANKVHFGDKSLAFILFGDESSNTTVPTIEDVIEETNDKQYPDTVMMDEIEVISDDDMDMLDGNEIDAIEVIADVLDEEYDVPSIVSKDKK